MGEGSLKHVGGLKKLSLDSLPFLDYANENECFSYNKISLMLK